MAYKDPLNLQLLQPIKGSLTEPNRSVDTELLQRTTGGVRSPWYWVTSVSAFRLFERCWSQITTKSPFFPGGGGISSLDHRGSHFPPRRQLFSYLSGGRNWLPRSLSASANLKPCPSAGLPGSGMSALILPGWK